MAGERLEYWTTLSSEELKHRVQLELSRMSKLTFAEQQLLDAALERLRQTREPISRMSRSQEIIMDTEKTETETEKQAGDPGPKGLQEMLPKISKPKKKKQAAPPPEASAPGKSEESDVKTKSKKTKTKAAKLKANSKAAANGRARIPADSKIFKTNKENPFREGTGSYKRVETVLKSSGQTAGTIMKKAGLKASTLSTMKRLGLIRVEA